MALVYADRVRETSTTTGTGTLTLAGAVAGYQSFSAVGNGNTCYYSIEAVDAAGSPTGSWEVGIGTYTSAGTTLARTSVLASSNAGAAVNFAAGTKNVFLTFPAGAIGTMASQNSSNVTITGGVIDNSAIGGTTPVFGTFSVMTATTQVVVNNNTGLRVYDASASFYLIIKPGSTLTANRTLTLTTGDANRTLTLSGDTTLGGGSHSGTNTGDEVAASDTVAGKIEIATAAEVTTGTDTTRAMVPGRFVNHDAAIKVWASITTSGGTVTLVADFGVSSVDDDGVGAYGFNFDTAFASATGYSLQIWQDPTIGSANATNGAQLQSQNAGSLEVRTYNPSNAAIDVAQLTIMCAGRY